MSEGKKRPDLTHVDSRGRVRMVDVGEKRPTRRTAVAEGWIRMQPPTLEAIREGALKKGDVLVVGRLAGITAAKRTSEWIPLAHPLPLDTVDVSLTMEDELPGVRAQALVGVTARTGVEMEALVAVSASLLTLYDMCKAIDRGMEIGPIRLLEKRGGRTGTWQREG